MTQSILRAARAHTPAVSTILRADRMSRAFVKYHLDDRRSLHRFTRPEPSDDPHDHPWSFETVILAGGYAEEVFAIRRDGSWHSDLIERPSGSIHRIGSTHIHRIVELPMRESWTLVRAGPHERTTMFLRFGDVVQRCAWNARTWAVNRCATLDQRRASSGRS